MALLLAMTQPEMDIVGIVTVSGNVPIEHVTRNACGVLKLVGRSIPVCQGSASPLVKKLFTASDVHGESGIGSLSLPDGGEHLVDTHFLDFYREKLYAAEEKTTIIALGPLTNIAILLKAYPEVAERIHQIVFMGGAIEEGNVTRYAEFNAYVDPEAYKIMFDSRIPCVMAGLDATHMSLLTMEDIGGLPSDTEVSAFVKELLTWYCRNVMETYGYPGCHMHDPSAIMYLIHPEVFTATQSRLDIITSDDHFRGKVVLDRSDGDPHVTVLRALDNEAFKVAFFHALQQYNR